MRYLVTGGLGVVGSVMADRIARRGDKVLVIDAAEAPRNRWVAEQLQREHKIEVVTARIERMRSTELQAAISTVDAVIHAAASTGIPHSVLHPDDDWRSNVDATRALLEALRLVPRPTAVLSSVKPYAVRPELMKGSGLDEFEPLEPDEPYAASKAAQSMLAMAYARSYGIPVVTFRCSNLYGPAPCHGPRHGWLTWFAISAAIGRPIEVQGTGRQSRDMLHAEDVLSACDLAIEHAGRLSGRVFNLGGGRENRIEVASAAADLLAMAGGGATRTAPPRAMDDEHVFVNSGRFLKETGWRPLVGVHDGIKAVFGWACENRDALAKLYAEI